MENYPNRENELSLSRPPDANVPSFQTIGGVVGAVFRLYRDKFVPVFKIVAVMTIPLIVAQYVFLNFFQLPWAQVIALFIFSTIGESLMAGALIYAVAVFLSTGAFPTLADSYRWGLKKWGIVLFCSTLYALIVALGLLALIVPGIIFSLMFALVIPVVVLENARVMQSFSRSSELTKNYRWQIFFTHFLFGLIIIVVSVITTSLGGAAGAEDSLLFAVTQGLVTQLLGSSSNVLTLFIYLGILKDLKQLPPGTDDTSAQRSDDWTRPSQVETNHEL